MVPRLEAGNLECDRARGGGDLPLPPTAPYAVSLKGGGERERVGRRKWFPLSPNLLAGRSAGPRRASWVEMTIRSSRGVEDDQGWRGEAGEGGRA
jgi:hypothetical protein